MKLYISVDMEGLAGITHWKDEAAEQVRFRNAMNQQVEWVLEGIQASSINQDITKITISDSHGEGENLSYDLLSEKDSRVYLVSGSPRPHYMMAALDDSYDLVFFVGYHAGAGTCCGAMDHTYSGRAVHSLKINGKLMNESTINAGFAGSLHVPVGLVIGDSALSRQLLGEKMMPWVRFVETKESLSRFSAVYRPKEEIRKDTIAAVKAVLEGDWSATPLYRLDSPYHLEMELTSSSMADLACLVPGCNRLDGRTLAFQLGDYGELMDCLLAVCNLAGRAYC